MKLIVTKTGFCQLFHDTLLVVLVERAVEGHLYHIESLQFFCPRCSMGTIASCLMVNKTDSEQYNIQQFKDELTTVMTVAS